ncbi:hypothetical protein BH18ACI3_BH18ACI3_17990 [soil metagenome]
MSKPFRLFSLLALLALSAVVALGQDIEATIEIDFRTPIVTVRGRYASGANNPARRNLAFLRTIAGMDNLASRVSGLSLRDSADKPVTFRKLMDGEYLSDADFARWTYQVDLTPPRNRNAAAHVSWLADGTGILMLADLLPRFGAKGTSARITFNTLNNTVGASPPPIFWSEPNSGPLVEVADTEDAVFYVGEGWVTMPNTFPGRLALSGKWNFKGADALGMAKEITDRYVKLFGSNTDGRPFIAIANFPVPTTHGVWQAETRGNNVTIISSDMPFRTQSLQRLHEQLRHEIFHLWIPNGVNLTGNYDWFYEGFALYESLKLAVALNRIRFEDFLDTLSRAHTIDSAGSQRTSLIQMSASRFSGANTQVYARGMLVGFLCDLAMLQQSKGKRSVDDLLKELFVKHRKPAAPADGNTAIVALLKANPHLISIVERYIAGADKLEWTSELAGAGIEDSDAGPLTSLRVREKLSGRQKDLLDKLGYNNWRKLSPTSK